MYDEARLPIARDNPAAAHIKSHFPVLFALTSVFPLIVLIAAVAFSSQPSKAQTGEWTWMSGTSTFTCKEPPTVPPTCTGPVGVYGTLGTPAAANVPGSRGYAATWSDTNGNLWLFGGIGFDSTVKVNDPLLNDLWEFNPITRRWTWMGGSSLVPPNGVVPGIYGTLGVPDAQNIPGGRMNSISWIDSAGRFWIFGGYGALGPSPGGGTYIADFNDLWEFDPSTLKWTWMGGSNTLYNNGIPGVYGTLGTPAPANQPGSRNSAAGWADGAGNLWLFGGNGNDIGNRNGYLNDLWKFDTSTREWAWGGGNNSIGVKGVQPGIYGTLGVPAAGNIPGGRRGPVTWVDKSGNFWLLGGSGFDSAGNYGVLNDLWEFNPSTAQWTWMSGSNILPPPASGQNRELPGVYGTLGVPGATNVPGSRALPVTSTDKNGNLLLVGGTGVDSVGTWGYLNDFWEFNIATREWTWISGGKTVPQPANGYSNGNAGVYGTLGVPAAANIPGGRTGSGGWTDNFNNLWLFGGWGPDSAGIPGQLNDLWEFLSVTAAPTLTPAQGTFASAQAVTISDATPGATIYYTIGGTTPTTASTKYTGAIKVSATETIKAIAVAPGYANSIGATGKYTLHLPQTINFAQPATPVTYGGKPVLLAATSTSGLPVTFSLVSGPATLTGKTLTIKGAGAIVLSASQPGNATYIPAAKITRTITVTKAALHVTANSLSMKKGATAPTLTYTMAGFVNGDTPAKSTTGKPALATTATAKSAAGKYPITIAVGTLAATNYSFAFLRGALTVTP